MTGAATARGRSDDRTLVLIRAVVERRDEERRGEERSAPCATCTEWRWPSGGVRAC